MSILPTNSRCFTFANYPSSRINRRTTCVRISLLVLQIICRSWVWNTIRKRVRSLVSKCGSKRICRIGNRIVFQARQACPRIYSSLRSEFTIARFIIQRHKRFRDFWFSTSRENLVGSLRSAWICPSNKSQHILEIIW